MTKVIITLDDEEDGVIGVRVEFDPPMDEERPLPIQAVASAVLNRLMAEAGLENVTAE